MSHPLLALVLPSLLAVLAAGALRAGDADAVVLPAPLASLPLWSEPAPGEPATPAKAERMEVGKDRITRANDVSVPTIDVYAPPAEQRTGTAVIVCPGGGYHILAWDLEGTEIVHWLNSCGVTGVLLKYRVPARPKQAPYIAPVQDLQRALSTVRSRAAEWGIKPDRIGALGFSAGGHAVAVASAGAVKRLYEAKDAIDQAGCRPDFTVLAYPAYLVANKQTLALNPEVTPAADAPPAFLVFATDDKLGSENPIAYYLALKKLGISTEMHLYATAGHGFGMRPSPHPAYTWTDRCREWMAERGLLGERKP
jgi:acetyl esterase/lipase